MTRKINFENIVLGALQYRPSEPKLLIRSCMSVTFFALTEKNARSAKTVNRINSSLHFHSPLHRPLLH